jgi:hypothetical protein
MEKASLASTILIGFAVFCFGTESIQTNEPQSLVCTLKAKSSKWTKGASALVSVSIESTSLEPKAISVSTFFELGGVGMQFWAPFKLAAGNKSEHLPANTRYKISLEPGQCQSYEVDLSKLKWERSISSIWPHLGLFELAQPGEYILGFNVEIESDKPRTRVISNRVDILIR